MLQVALDIVVSCKGAGAAQGGGQEAGQDDTASMVDKRSLGLRLSSTNGLSTRPSLADLTSDIHSSTDAGFKAQSLDRSLTRTAMLSRRASSRSLPVPLALNAYADGDDVLHEAAGHQPRHSIFGDGALPPLTSVPPIRDTTNECTTCTQFFWVKRNIQGTLPSSETAPAQGDELPPCLASHTI